jgi:predicted Zn-dependent protease
MVGMFNTLRTQGQLTYTSPPPWLVTHPLPAERLARLQNTLAEETGLASNTASLEAQWPRIQAKVAALTLSPAATLRRYNGADATARYARALAQLRLGKLDETAALLAPLLQQSPRDAYYLELQGQLASQRADLAGATAAFKAALQQVPNGLLLRYQLAEMLRAQGHYAASDAQYREITRNWPIWAEPWEGLGRSLGQQKDLTGSHLAFAEAALADGDIERAKQSFALAENYLKTTPNPENSSWLDTLKERLK